MVAVAGAGGLRPVGEDVPVLDEAGAGAPERPLADRLARNTFLNALGLGLPLLVALFAIPPIVEGLGPERFGILGMIWIAVSYLALLDLGLGRATTRYAAAALADGEVGRLREIVAVAAPIQLVLGVSGGAAAALLAGPIVTGFLELSPALHREAVWSFVGLAAIAPAVAITNSFRGVLEAAQRFGLINLVRAPVTAANFLVPLAGVLLGWSLPAIVAGMALVRVGALLAFAAACLRAWPELRGRLSVKGERLRELVSFGGWVTVSAVISPLLVYADRFLVGAAASVEAAGYYTVPHEIVTRMEILPASLVLTLFPALAALSTTGPDGGGEADERASLIYRAVEYLLATVAPLLIALAVLSHDVLALWMGGEFAVRADVPLRLLAIGMLANSIAFVPYAAIQAAGRPDLTARFHLIELPIHLVLVWVLTARMGIAGAALAWLIRVVLDALLLLGASIHLDLGSGTGWMRSRVPVLAGALLVFGGATLGATAVASEAIHRIGLVVVLLAGWAAWFWWRLLGRGERRRILAAAGLRRTEPL